MTAAVVALALLSAVTAGWLAALRHTGRYGGPCQLPCAELRYPAGSWPELSPAISLRWRVRSLLAYCRTCASVSSCPQWLSAAWDGEPPGLTNDGAMGSGRRRRPYHC